MRRLFWPVVLLAAACVLVNLLAGTPGLRAIVVEQPSRGPFKSLVLYSGVSSIDQLLDGTKGPTTVRWFGSLFVKQGGQRYFEVSSRNSASITIDDTVVVRTDQAGDVNGRVPLEPGPHRISVEYHHDAENAGLDVAWDGSNAYRPDAIPGVALSPTSIAGWRWHLRPLAAALTVTTSLTFSGLIVFLLGRVVWAALPGGAMGLSARSKVTLWGLGGLFVAGGLWGVPAFWAPDELDPASVLDALQLHFANGWFGKYPPLHYVLITVIYWPLLAAERLGWLSLQSVQDTEWLYIAGRGLTVAMALGTIAIVMRLATRLASERIAWLAGLVAGVFLPFTFYAKTTNLDVPYLFWSVVALLFLDELVSTCRVRHAVALGIAAAAAVATKDQAYGLFLLPGLYVIWLVWRRTGRPTTALAAGAAAAAALVIFDNVLFNYEGFRAHVDAITTAGSDYRMFPVTLAGEWSLVRLTAREFLECVGWAGLCLILAGVVLATPSDRRKLLPWWLRLVLVSYLVTVLGVLGYSYDRFLLPVTTLLSITAAAGAVSLWSSQRATAVARVVAVLLVTWSVWRAVSIDLLMARDGRYAAEEWLRSHVGWNDTVGAIDESGYLPRLDEFRNTLLRPNPRATESAAPAFVVVNTEYLERFDPRNNRRVWYDWLRSADSGYQEVFRYKAPLDWSAMAMNPIFNDKRESLLTNLDKINPEIAIYQRRP